MEDQEFDEEDAKTTKRYREKVDESWETFQQIQKLKEQLSKLSCHKHEVHEDANNEINAVKTKAHKMEQNIVSKIDKLANKRKLDQAVLYLARHPEMMELEPIATERLLLCWWTAKCFKNFRIVVDLLVEHRIVTTIDEIDSIVLALISQDVGCSDSAHKYVEYLGRVCEHELSLAVWQAYLKQVLLHVGKGLEFKIDGTADDDMHAMTECLIQAYKDSCGDVELSARFGQLLKASFEQLETFLSDCTDQAELNNRRRCFRSVVLSLLENRVSLNSLLIENNRFCKLMINELVLWAGESQEVFKALFPKLDFKNKMLPWSVFKGIKDAFKSLESNKLYLYVTKYFLDNFDSDEELCNAMFTSAEYKSLVKHLMNSNEDLSLDDGLTLNSNNEAEFDGFIILS